MKAVKRAAMMLVVGVVAGLAGVAGASTWVEDAKLLADDGAESDYFGYSVSLSGDLAVIGAQNDDDNGSASGSAYVCDRNEGGADNWGQVAKLTASDGAVDDWFGWSVSTGDDLAVVGAYGDDDDGDKSGSAYVFGRNEGGADNWGQVAKLTASDAAADDQFGRSVSVSGDAAIVGVYRDDDNGSFSGSAYVFGQNEGGADNWGQVTKLTASDAAASDKFGYSVSISGDLAVVGAHFDNNDNGAQAGSAYVFARNEGGADNWGQVAKLITNDGAVSDHFGYSVSVTTMTTARNRGRPMSSGGTWAAPTTGDRSPSSPQATALRATGSANLSQSTAISPSWGHATTMTTPIRLARPTSSGATRAAPTTGDRSPN